MRVTLNFELYRCRQYSSRSIHRSCIVTCTEAQRVFENFIVQFCHGLDLEGWRDRLGLGGSKDPARSLTARHNDSTEHCGARHTRSKMT